MTVAVVVTSTDSHHSGLAAAEALASLALGWRFKKGSKYCFWLLGLGKPKYSEEAPHERYQFAFISLGPVPTSLYSESSCDVVMQQTWHFLAYNCTAASRIQMSIHNWSNLTPVSSQQTQPGRVETEQLQSVHLDNRFGFRTCCTLHETGRSSVTSISQSKPSACVLA